MSTLGDFLGLKRTTNAKEPKPIKTPVVGFMTKPIPTFTELHRKHGGLVQTELFGHKTLFVSDPKIVEEVFVLEGKGLVTRDFMYEARKPLFKNGLINSHTHPWKEQRRLMQPLFNKDAIGTWQALIEKEAATTANRIKAMPEITVNVTKEIKRTVHSIALQILFGKLTTADGNNKALLNSIDTITNGMAKLLAAEVFGKGQLRWLLTLQKNKYEKALLYFTSFVQKQIDEKTGNGYGHDILSMLMQSEDKGTGYKMPKDLLHDEMVNLFFAGQDTTNHALAWFFYLIGKHKDSHKQITKEITASQSKATITEKIAAMPYTKAALYETLRLYPPVIARALHCVEDVEIGGLKVAKNTIVLFSLCATHRDDEIWEEPEKFTPERFMPDAVAQRHRYSWYPFGGGGHNCIGKHLAELEMMTIIATILSSIAVRTEASIKPAVSLTLRPERDIIVQKTNIHYEGRH
ncbi:cytochrome P450 family 4 subfamily V [biofilm metagenome]